LRLLKFLDRVDLRVVVGGEVANVAGVGEFLAQRDRLVAVQRAADRLKMSCVGSWAPRMLSIIALPCARTSPCERGHLGRDLAERDLHRVGVELVDRARVPGGSSESVVICRRQTP
jgi:hypothetical protein